MSRFSDLPAGLHDNYFQRFWLPEAGKVLSIKKTFSILIEILNIELLELRFSPPSGLISGYNSNLARAGLIITKGESIKDAELLADEAAGSTLIQTAVDQDA